MSAFRLAAIGLGRLLLLVFVMVSSSTAAPVLRMKEIEPRIWCCDFESEALTRAGRFVVILPEAAARDKSATVRYPVIYFLHGRGRNEHSLLDSPVAKERLLASPCVIILPRGDDGWYINSPVDTRDRYADYIDEIISLAETNFPVANAAPHRAIGGWSMGGYGAAFTTVRRPGDFRALATIIGVLDFPRAPIPGSNQNYTVPVKRFGSDEAVWKKLNPRLEIAHTAGTALLMVIGEAAFDRQMNEAFIEAATQAGNTPKVLRLPGGHTFTTVENAIPEVFDFLESEIR